MKGKNTLKLNISTMHEAVQLWVDAALNAKPRVVAVRQVAPIGYGQDIQPMFYEIDVDDGEKDDKKQPPACTAALDSEGSKK